MYTEKPNVSIENFGLKVKNYKGFGDEASGFQEILPVNLIIGRNNTGKSTLLDLIHYAVTQDDLSSLGHRGKVPQVILEGRPSDEQISRAFPQNQQSADVRRVWNVDDWSFGRLWIGKRLVWELGSSMPHKILDFDLPENFERYRRSPHEGNVREQLTPLAQRLVSYVENPFSRYKFERIRSDRDITPEPEGDRDDIVANGAGFTSTVERYIHNLGLPERLVEQTMLQELNRIFEPDGTFTDIGIQRHEDGRWEVYLEEEAKGRVLLANTGSGLKTILLVLAFLILVPDMEKRPLGEYLFGFEELENNLHPALQRRLLLYLRNIAVEQGCKIFLTTHSNVSIDLFAEDHNAQILHVRHNGNQASVRSVTTYVHNKGILDDLDVRASDLLQANGVIWVEGPSDRIYFNRWMKIFSNGEFQEGVHYQCVFYGGRLLAHLSAEEPDVDKDEALKILRVNRNAVIIIDSDKKRLNQPIGSTKKRIVGEMKRIEGMSWVTKGREVENYIPADAIAGYLERDSVKPPDRFVDFADYLNRMKSGEGRRFERNKVLFADRISRFISRKSAGHVLDLEKQMSKVLERVREWNR